MIALDDILDGLSIIKRAGPLREKVDSVYFDSRLVTPGSMFVAVRGTHSDGHGYIDNAIQGGAEVIICENIPQNVYPQILYLQVEDSALSLGIVSSNYYGNPSSKLSLIGITGTNGKTTTATLLYGLFRSLGKRAGLISTIHHQINDALFPTAHTTPDALHLNQLLDRMVSEGCSHCFMEVSSHGIAQKRIAGLTFAGAVFTNITHDHLDYHADFMDYLQTKKKFFDGLPAQAFALTNLDDKNGRVMIQNTRAHTYTYALKHLADFRCRIIENRLDGLQLEMNRQRVWFRLAGQFNAYNILAVYAAATLLREDASAVLTLLSNAAPVQGRFETIRSQDNVIAIIDYAHTPDALVNVLDSLLESRSGEQKLITVIGAGGDRDITKRPEMGQIAAERSDRVIITSDNPRSEDPAEIIRQIIQGVDTGQRNKVVGITDRKEALQTASFLARPGDLILVAGKGHETYQEIKGVKYPFDDKQIMEEIFLTRTPNLN